MTQTREPHPPPPTRHRPLREWVERMVDLCRPEAVHWCDGSSAEYQRMLDRLVATGAARRLDPHKRPDSALVWSDAADVARVEDRTFICTADPEDAGPTNNWADPKRMKAKLHELFAGAMAGRTMYVIAFCMGPVDSPIAHVGVEITDSPYVVANMHIMTRVGTSVLRRLEKENTFVPCLHSVGYPLVLPDGSRREEIPWPCDPERRHITHFPRTREVWSYGSGYGGNALLGKKCFALRIASVMARDQGWLAEHMLILKLTSPRGQSKYIAGAFPSGCGKTNLAMLKSTLPGWEAQTIGDDIAWMAWRPDTHGRPRLHAINPEAGFFGVAPGTSWNSNPHAMASMRENAIFTNCALTDDGDVWWEGMAAPPNHLTSWRGRDWHPRDPDKAAHPNARFTAPADQCPTIAPEWEDPAGVPIDAILFGGRRAGVAPLVQQALSWAHGVFLGSIMSSEKTAAAGGRVGELRRDPMAMLPFCGYHMADYWDHWLKMGQGPHENVHDDQLPAGRDEADRPAAAPDFAPPAGPDGEPASLPKIFHVNWFRKDEDGRYLWPGFGDNSRVLAWIFQRCDDAAPAHRTPIGLMPPPEAIDTRGLDIAADEMEHLLSVDVEAWLKEVAAVRTYYRRFGDRLPAAMTHELDALEQRLREAR